VVDVPELCSFILPALHRQDPITVSCRRAAPHRCSRSGCATRSPASSGPSMRRWRCGCASSALGEAAPADLRARRDYFAGIVRDELG
jgi:hypothetical protein